MSESNWISMCLNGGVPGKAIIAGKDSDGSPILVGRAEHKGDMIAAKVIPTKSSAYICYGGKEISKCHFEVLCEDDNYRFKWVSSACGRVPSNAVKTGATSDGECLYIGRAEIYGSLTPGKLHPSHGCLYVPYGGAEHSFQQYEVLVAEKKLQWVSAHCCHIPEGAILAGEDIDRNSMYICRADHLNEVIPGKQVPKRGEAYICHAGKEHAKHQVEVLCNGNTSWVETSGCCIPDNAVPAGHTECGETLYIGRTQHECSLTIGKVHPSHGALYIPFGGKEVLYREYEILVENEE